MRKINKLIIFITICLAFTTTAFAHSGRTDSMGGHHDYKNASGLGSYHYHHGYSAHLHPNGVCPYETNTYQSSSSSNTTSYKTYSIPKEKTQATDIKTYIDQYSIPSVNYKNSQYIIAEDLSNYGYDVVWNNSDRTLKIKKNTSKDVSQINTNLSGEYEIQPTDIKTYIYDEDTGNYKQATSYNIGGRTIVKFSELGDTSWNGTERVTTLSY